MILLLDPNIVWLDFLEDLVDIKTSTMKNQQNVVEEVIISSLPANTTTSSSGNSSNSSGYKTSQDILNESYTLKPEYHHDGTHLHPRYAALVERAINRF